MTFKNRKIKTIMSAMAILAIFGGTANSAYAEQSNIAQIYSAQYNVAATYKDGNYTIKNVVISDSDTGYAMVRGMLKETSNLEIKGGKYYLTFEMGQSNFMKNIVIKSGSKTLKYTSQNIGNDTRRIKVEIPSLTSKLNISTYVIPMSRNVSFGLKLDTSTLKSVNSSKVTAPKSVKASGTSYNSAKISWGKVSGATGYEVYQYNSSSKKYTKVDTTKSTSYTKTGLTTGTTYKFKVRAYKIASGKTTYSDFSSVVSTKPELAKVTNVKATNSAKSQAKLTWSKVSGASGYEVLRASSSNGSYKTVKTVTSGSTVSFTDSKLEKGKTCYYKVRAYTTVNGKKVYGSYSNVISVQIKK